MPENQPKTYTVSGPKGAPILGMLAPAKKNALAFMMDLAVNYGDIVPFHILGQNIVQINHPELVKYVLVDNHKNYKKSSAYIRFESVLGKGLFTSEGEKWRRDRQKIQPMFKREQVEGYYFDVISEVSEKFKERWFRLTENGNVELNLTSEMADITLEIIAKLVFGKNTIDAATVTSIHHAYDVFMAYLKQPRLIPTVDFRKIFHTPEYMQFNKELVYLRKLFTEMLNESKKNTSNDRLNMLALLLDAQAADPQNFTDADILEQCFTMIFAGFESTSILIQWMWYALDERPDVREKLRTDIAIYTSQGNFTYEGLSQMRYMKAFFDEAVRLYPPFWITGREPIADDRFGDYKIKRGTKIVLPQFAMQRHPRYWKNPNAFMPERFMSESSDDMHPGLYFPFSHGPRKCSGNKLAEMEAKVVIAKLLPYFELTLVNTAAQRNFDSAISLKPEQPLKAMIRRI